MNVEPRYIVDGKNRKVAVQLDIKTYEKIEEILENYALYRFMRNDGDSENDMETLSRKEAKEYYEKLKRQHES